MCKEKTCPPPWERQLAAEADLLLATRPGEVFQALAPIFQAILVERALAASQGCRQRAADLLGIGRNTIELKIDALRPRTRDDAPGQAFVPLGLKDFFRRDP